MSERRTYFYQLDARGRLFHEGTELNDPQFLDFFISRIQKNKTGLYPEFPYLSLCVGEWNFIQPSTSVFVFRKLESGKLFYSPSHSLPFQPDQLRIYRNSLVHPSPLEEWGSFSQELLLEISKNIFEKENTFYFQYEDKEFQIRILP
ncbi:hypothetical protein A0128_08970 [Leptospira tipperaryensis]|uniref:DUF4505 domain-containing protein n=1 Tax=Leptospira tipperaryensis TaxID=2564040 RepID=A0A1D7UWI6_9LEPT|nr:DUF4505 family protein [Leptospira tipperaryensis]AOP33960.1 hypothetical protein A0128_08970 [Leptospira tipperaryensis]